MIIQGIIFDFDGIIADTERLHYQAFQEVLVPKDLGFSWEDYVQTYMGFDDRGVFEHVHAQQRLDLGPEALRALIASKADWFEAQAASGKIPLFPGAKERIIEAAERGPVGLCSGALKSDIAPIFDQYELWPYFRFMVTAEDVEESKPHPASYKLAAQLLQEQAGGSAELPLQAILAIEDTPAGIASARGAQLRTVGIGHTYPLAELADADAVRESLEKLNFEDLQNAL